MVGDRPIFKTEVVHELGDFLEGVVPVAPGRMIVQRAAQIRPLDEPGQIIFFGGGKFAVVLAQFRRDEGQIQFRKNFRLVPARHEQFRIARFLLGFEQAVFVQPQAARNRPLAHDDVVLLAAGEIRQRKRKLLVAHHAQVALDAAVQNHTRLGVAPGGDFDDPRLRDKKFNHLRRLLRRRQQVNVADDFLEPPQTARRAATNHVRMFAQIFEQRFGGAQGVAQQMFRGVSPPALDAFENVRLRLFAKAVEPGDLAGFARRFQFPDRINAELLIQRLDFLWSQSGNFQHFNQARRDGRFQFVVVSQLAGFHQLVETGKLAYYDELKASIPPGLVAMLEIPGLGPKKIQALHQKLGIDSIEKLEAACKAGKVAELDGFGEKTQANILEGIERRRPYASKHLLSDALRAAEPLLESLREHPDVIRCSAAGSLRRFKEVIGDIDLLASSKKPAEVIEFFAAQPGIVKVTAQGDTKASVIFAGGIQCDLRVVSDAEFPFALAYFTGSKEHNIVMRQRAIARGLRLNEYGLFKSKEETRDPKLLVPCQDEAEIFAKLDLPYIPPELREDHGEFAAAEKNDLPRLIEWTDLKGSLHNHSTWSDGHNTLGGNRRVHGRTRPRILGHHRPLQVVLPGQRPGRRARARSKSRKSKNSTNNSPNAAATSACSPAAKWTF